jgi:uncharacterized protein (TIGR02588 family)
MTKNASRKPATQPGTTVEWAFGAIAAALVAALIGYFTYQGLTDEGRPPAFVLSLETSEEMGEGLAITIAVGNTGQQTAADVSVVGTVGAETREVVIDYLPPDSTRRVTMIFSGAQEVPPELQITGYREP